MTWLTVVTLQEATDDQYPGNSGIRVFELITLADAIDPAWNGTGAIVLGAIGIKLIFF